MITILEKYFSGLKTVRHKHGGRIQTYGQKQSHRYGSEIHGILLAPPTLINISTELEMTSDAGQNGGKARYVKHCK